MKHFTYGASSDNNEISEWENSFDRQKVAIYITHPREFI